MPSPIWPLALVAGMVLAGPAAAGAVTFADAVRLAEAQAPSLKARALEVDSARAASRSAGALPDPRLNFGVDNFPVSGPSAGRFGADEMTMTVVGVSQDIPSRTARKAERSLAGADVAAAEAGVEVERRKVRLAAAVAWIDLYYAERRIAALDGVLMTLQPIWDAAPSALAAGAARPAQTLAPVRTRAALEDQREELLAARGRARAELSRWTADPDPQASGPPPATAIDAEALRAGLDQLPSLTAYRSATRRAEANVALAEAGKRPDWSLEASYGHRDPMFGDMVSAGVSVRLPLFAASRQDPQIAARRLDASRVAAEAQDARRTLLAQFDGDIADHLMHHAQWHRATEILTPAAEQQSTLETASYGAGRAGLSDVIEAFSQLADAKLTALEREAAVARDAVRISFTYGRVEP